ncbi:MAG: tRNA lysidine(34) synthetase TilS [Gemmatimonadaceae bacterium]
MLHDPPRAVLQAARHVAREHRAPLLLAVSGGLDSMVLLHAMARVARSRIAAVATYDHGTGVAATAAVAHVARAAAALTLPMVTDVMSAARERTTSREADWRRARYRFLRASAHALGARLVTAHSEDDQIETVLMRVMRGSGARGIAALYAPSDVCRPFLGIRRATLECYARDAGVEWRDDPTNDSREFLRNRVRHDLLPAMRHADPTIEDALLAIARRAMEWRDHIASVVDAGMSVVRPDRESIAIARAELSGYDRGSLCILWSEFASRVGLALDRRGTDRLASFITKRPAAGWVQLSGGWCVEATRDAYVLRRRPADAPDELALPEHGEVQWGSFRFRVVDGDQVPSAAVDDLASVWQAAFSSTPRHVVRRWMAGDRLAPEGGRQRRRVKRYLTEAGVRGLDRPEWPVVVTGDDVVWIPGVRRSNAASERSGRPVRHYICERLDR